MFLFGVPERLKLALAALIVVVMVLALLGKQYPDVAWLQVFRSPANRLTNEQRTRIRRSQNRLAGVELILAGVIVPLAYFALTVMFFNEPTLGMSVMVGAIANSR